MIVWLASYPRSGNTFLRVVLHRLYGLPTYSIYDDNDPVAQLVGPDLVGYRPKPVDRVQMTDGPDVYFVKTHKRRKADRYPAIYLARDGRDAVVSHARLRATTQTGSADGPELFESLLREEITRTYIDGQPSSGNWGSHVTNWLDETDAPLVVIRYEELIADPRAAAERAVSALLPNMTAAADACIPSFGDLHTIEPHFFRRGVAGSHADEMPDTLHQLFWAQPGNTDAMQRLGYAT
jgi:hypothetical protein